jgi:hypothetical protein
VSEKVQKVDGSFGNLCEKDLKNGIEEDGADDTEVDDVLAD